MRFREFMFRYVGWLSPRPTDCVNAKPVWPAKEWEGWWRELVEAFQKAGLPVARTDFWAIEWWTCDEIPVWLMNRIDLQYGQGTEFAGVWMEKDNAIVLVQRYVGQEVIVKHEMTHAIRHQGGHGHEYFRTEFGNYTGDQPEELMKK